MRKRQIVKNILSKSRSSVLNSVSKVKVKWSKISLRMKPNPVDFEKTQRKRSSKSRRWRKIRRKRILAIASLALFGMTLYTYGPSRLYILNMTKKAINLAKEKFGQQPDEIINSKETLRQVKINNWMKVIVPIMVIGVLLLTSSSSSSSDSDSDIFSRAPKLFQSATVDEPSGYTFSDLCKIPFWIGEIVVSYSGFFLVNFNAIFCFIEGGLTGPLFAMCTDSYIPWLSLFGGTGLNSPISRHVRWLFCDGQYPASMMLCYFDF